MSASPSPPDGLTVLSGHSRLSLSLSLFLSSIVKRSKQLFLSTVRARLQPRCRHSFDPLFDVSRRQTEAWLLLPLLPATGQSVARSLAQDQDNGRRRRRLRPVKGCERLREKKIEGERVGSRAVAVAVFGAVINCRRLSSFQQRLRRRRWQQSLAHETR